MVEQAFQRPPSLPERPVKVTGELPRCAAEHRREVMLEAWRAGVPLAAIALVIGSNRSTVHRRVRQARKAAATLPGRRRGWYPPWDWPRRLDAVIAAFEKRGGRAEV